MRPEDMLPFMSIVFPFHFDLGGAEMALLRAAGKFVMAGDAGQEWRSGFR